ncbi:MAG: 1,4-dihydroxy-2-naphthoate polyprenyltransferase [Planctomycetes bacterium]|nr:1,4-dihydroxy-2-naphthoate polyprenyltransferase [Planctomycetota bacterium]
MSGDSPTSITNVVPPDPGLRTPDSGRLSTWLLATRPKTLAAGAVPVLVGTALGATLVPINWLAALGCLIGALLIQIGCNFANDAFDALKGADSAARIGPQRAVASGLISPRAMLIATGIVLALAFIVGLWLASFGGWIILVLGVISLVCAVAYTAGPFPLAYVGLGDLFVFLFFGLVAVIGSGWVQAAPALAALLPFDQLGAKGFAIANWSQQQIGLHAWSDLPRTWWLVASAVGLQATGIIAVNNLRDIATDVTVGKRTLAVRLGDRLTRVYTCLLHLAATVCLVVVALKTGGWLWLPAVVAGVGGLLLCSGLVRATGPALNGYLARSAALELITGLCLTAALIIAARNAL